MGMVSSTTEGSCSGPLTPLSTGGNAHNGFDALIDLDTNSNADGRLDHNDAAYQLLRMWFDVNHNGTSEPSELVPLSQVGIKAILLAYATDSKRDRYGNAYLFRGDVLIEKRGVERRRTIFDVFLSVTTAP